MKKLTAKQKKEAFEELCRFDALPPYESSYTAADGFFANSLMYKYKTTIDELRDITGEKKYMEKWKKNREQFIEENYPSKP